MIHLSIIPNQTISCCYWLVQSFLLVILLMNGRSIYLSVLELSITCTLRRFAQRGENDVKNCISLLFWCAFINWEPMTNQLSLPLKWPCGKLPNCCLPPRFFLLHWARHAIRGFLLKNLEQLLLQCIVLINLLSPFTANTIGTYSLLVRTSKQAQNWKNSNEIWDPKPLDEDNRP